MNEQQPTGPKPRWWNRPSTGHPRATEPAPATGPAEPLDEARPAPAAADSIESPGPAEAPVDTYDLAPPAPTRPAPVDEGAAAPAAAGTAAAPGTESAHLPAVDAPRAERIGPLHAPDPYGTPPYGGPGPWAPAPPVQRPVPTPPGGTVLPPQGTYAAAQAPATPAPPYPGPAPAEAAPAVPGPGPQGPAGPAPQWGAYDPWGAPHEPFSAAGPVPEPRRRRRGALLAGAVLLALVAGGIGGGVGAYVERNGRLTSVHLPQADKEPQGRAPDSVAGIAASALPSVVTIHVTGATESGTGTGFVLDNAGHILTNNHVVQPAGTSGKISVTFSGGESASAQVVGRDAGYDLAVVRVDGVSGMKPLALGNSDNVMVGDPVVAIGAPFDLSNTVTSGIISAKERPITAGGESGDGSDVSYVDALQTDAPINPGNSGGPLVDSKARVIGINSAIRSAGSGSTEAGGQAGSIGLGFAIPVNQAKRVAEELINTGRATHPVIGVTLDMKYSGDGARVGDKASDGKPAVVPGGPGDKAGVKAQDVITKVDGQRVHGGEELIVKIRAHRPGDRLVLTVLRGGTERELTLTLGSAS
ncbi:S1C family serine protease [Streptomyces sp. NBC_00083]|uniref:S1C family serine protease n=1 Tax=Streptomyces sp. NBC_00083 TaxID=2975647 RepID=UPI0022551FDA|nr:trypsin-like peptidase domain-containing protein [Streptomyces sp. NBC_00083]MCX5385469.1 trypsin-like peptidase domain-containing protein [Streptomyces sp. NBC_00083]